MKVFIIDDDITYLLWAENVLKLAGIDVQYSLNDSPNLIDEIEKYQPDSILVDLYMPKLDGVSLIKLIKKREKLRFIPAVCFSSSESIIDKVKAMQAGFVDYFNKPMDSAAFLNKVKSYNSLGRILKLCNGCGELG